MMRDTFPGYDRRGDVLRWPDSANDGVAWGWSRKSGTWLLVVASEGHLSKKVGVW